VLQKSKKYEPIIISSGMHMIKKYGFTYEEILKDFKNIQLYKFKNHNNKNNSMDLVVAKTINQLNKIICKIKPDLFVIHGDRCETLAAAICCNLNNILVAHIEGGEVSGTADESIRHASTKLSHIHFTSNLNAKKNLVRLGENTKNIHVIGSPEVDTMVKNNLPSIEEVKKRYDIKFNKYAILLFHPVTTLDKKQIHFQCKQLFEAIIISKRNFVVIFPNNDKFSEIIMSHIISLKKNNRFKILPSLRFEYYLTLLKHSDFIIGNSSSGVREASVFGTKAINLGDRQKNRSADSRNIRNLDFDKNKIINTISKINLSKKKINFNFGRGNSSIKFIKVLEKNFFWDTCKQKYLI
jgi:UDP-N-acetylglucosamine 2-epimerase (hydrolysing)